MGLLDIFKANENKKLRAQIEEIKTQLSPEQLQHFDLKEDIIRLNNQKVNIEKQISTLESKIEKLNGDIVKKKQSLINLDEEILLQDFGLYRPLYDFATSDIYKDKLAEIRQVQKDMIHNKTAVSFLNTWTVNGSKAEGKKMINNTIKQILRSFNTECENAIDRVKFNNFDSMEKRIRKSFEDLNKMNVSCQVSITEEYLKLKLDELHLAFEYQEKKQEEKEEAKRRREEMREEAKLQKELEDARKNIYKDQKHFQKALNQVKSQLDSSDISIEQRQLLSKKYADIQSQLNQLDSQLKDIDYRQSNQRAGYVYIISNIGAFGENVYKIGMTRRLEPQDRVDELGDASVPFNFDVHAMIFTEDAPALESALHKAFETKKLNMVNQRREFFNVSLDEIEQVVKANFDKTVDFVKTPPAEQYRESLKLRFIHT